MPAAAAAKPSNRWAADALPECAARPVSAAGISLVAARPVEEAGLPADCKPVEQAKKSTAGFDSQAGLLNIVALATLNLTHF